MNSDKDFCTNVCALMAKLNQALYIQHSLQFIWQKVWGLFEDYWRKYLYIFFFFYVKKNIINQVLIYYGSWRCLLFHLIMCFNCLSDNFYTCMATILDKMC